MSLLGEQARAGGFELGPAHVGCRVQHLALQIAEVDDVEIHDAEATDAGGGKVEGSR